MTTLRKATLHDAPAVWDLRIHAIGQQCAGFYPPGLIQKWTEGEINPGFSAVVAAHFYVIEVAGELVASGMVDLSCGKIDAVFVAPHHFRKGYGAQMLDYLEAKARAAGLAQLHLDATLNGAAFYRARGFCGDAIGHYASPRGIVLECVPMKKNLA